jgi:hypothetical protein
MYGSLGRLVHAGGVPMLLLNRHASSGGHCRPLHVRPLLIAGLLPQQEHAAWQPSLLTSSVCLDCRSPIHSAHGALGKPVSVVWPPCRAAFLR